MSDKLKMAQGIAPLDGERQLDVVLGRLQLPVPPSSWRIDYGATRLNVWVRALPHAFEYAYEAVDSSGAVVYVRLHGGQLSLCATVLHDGVEGVADEAVRSRLEVARTEAQL